MLPPYSVLMSVYYKERPEFLHASMESMFTQTAPPDDFVLVCDGPLTEELDAAINQIQQEYSNILNVVRLEKNSGLGNALNMGLQHCKYELIARMDSDDISRPKRCELQLKKFEEDSKLDIVSGTIEEFNDSITKIIGKRVLPVTYDEICRFSKKRNPFNHMAVMYKKKSVINAGNYSEKFHLFEDYYLWIRMLMNGCYANNIDEPLVWMRMPLEAYGRRGGLLYAKDMLRFHQWMKKSGWTNWIDYISGAVIHAIICVLPIRVREIIYRLIRT